MPGAGLAALPLAAFNYAYPTFAPSLPPVSRLVGYAATSAAGAFGRTAVTRAIGYNPIRTFQRYSPNNFQSNFRPSSMPHRSRYARRRAPTRRRAPARRARYRQTRIPRSLGRSSQTVTVRSTYNASIAMSTGSMYFKVALRNPTAVLGVNVDTVAGQTINWAAFAALYDAYKINWVKLQYIPFNPDNSTNDSNGPLAVFLHNDAPSGQSTPSDISACMVRPGAKLVQSNKPWSYFIRPNYISNSGSPSALPGFYDTATPVTIGYIQGRMTDRGSLTDSMGSVLVTYSLSFASLKQTS